MYHCRFMPCLKHIIQHAVYAVSDKLRMLRVKTIECISLIGLAVGKEKVNDCAAVYSLCYN